MTSEIGKRASLSGAKASAFDGELQFGVTADTYHGKAKSFILAHGNKGFVIACRPTNNVEKLTPRQWGAWLSYFKHLGKPTSLMDRLGYFTVPAEWPHLFDADATVQADHQAADGYEARERERVRSFNLSRTVQGAVKSTSIWPQIRREKFEPTPDDHLRQKSKQEESDAKLREMGLEHFQDRVPAAPPHPHV